MGRKDDDLAWSCLFGNDDSVMHGGKGKVRGNGGVGRKGKGKVPVTAKEIRAAKKVVAQERAAAKKAIRSAKVKAKGKSSWW